MTDSSRSRWWDRYRDHVMYPVACVGLAALGLVWKPALSLILSPLWVVLIVWTIPNAVARRVWHRP